MQKALDQILRKDARNTYFKAMAYWLIANCLAAVLLTQRPQIEGRWPVSVRLTDPCLRTDTLP